MGEKYIGKTSLTLKMQVMMMFMEQEDFKVEMLTPTNLFQKELKTL